MELTELLGMETGKERTAEPDGGGSREERPGRWRTILPWLLLVAGLICVGLAMGSSCFVPGSDLGIIGGADGPTAILVTSNAAPNFWLWSLLAGLCLGVASGTLGRRLWRRILRRREDKERS